MDLRSAKVQRVSEVLQFPIVIKWVGPLPPETKSLQKLNLALSRIPAEGGITEKFPESRLFVMILFGFFFNKLNIFFSPFAPLQ